MVVSEANVDNNNDSFIPATVPLGPAGMSSGQYEFGNGSPELL